jgi:nucleoside-diphosphate-sugar epimerase
MEERKKILIAGDLGVVGFAAAKHFSGLPEWDVVGISRRTPQRSHGGEHFSVDLQNKEQCAEVFSQMQDVTHVVYAALYEKPGLIPGWSERDQMDTNLKMLQNLVEPLEKAATGLEHFILLQGTKAYGVHVGPMKLPGKEREPRHQHENFYWLQEDYLREKQENGRGWGWTILRPQIVCGEALGSNMNPVAAIGAYAAIKRQAGEPLDFPGQADFLAECVDADLLARAMGWVMKTPEKTRGEYFNVTNGDVFVMRNVWPTIADAFGMEVGEDKPMSLANDLPKYQRQWEEIVREFDLQAPTDLKEFLGQSGIYADFCLGYGFEELPPMLSSTIKLRQAGFQECMDTEDMFRKWIVHFQQERLLPRVPVRPSPA